MPGTLVSTVKTPSSHSEMIASMVKAWKQLFNEIPSKKSVCLILSQNAHETGNKTAFWNYNIGNIKRATNQDVKYMMLKGTWELIGGRRIVFEPPNPATHFLSFDSLDEGMYFHLNKLANGRFKSCWDYVVKGDIVGFVTAIKNKNYFTGNLQDYIRNMNFYFNKFMKDDTYEKVVSELESEVESEVDFSIFPLSPQSLTEPTEKINTQEYSTLASFVSENEPTIKSVVNPTTQPKSNSLILILNFLKSLFKIR